MPSFAQYRICALVLLSFSAQAEWYSKQFNVMGTVAKVELWHDDAEAAQQAIAAVETEMHRIDAAMSPMIESSELSHINREAARQPLLITNEMFELLKTSVHFSELTDGVFDITFSSVGYLYDYRKHIHPDEKAIASHLSGIDYHHIHLDEAQRTVFFDQPGVRIDLGGIGKGYAVDQCIELLRKRGITHAFVNAGGDSYVLGDRHGRPWFISIRHPRDSSKQVATLPLADLAISTSGDYERFFIDENGVRYHHIMNPRTGDSARESESVSIIAANATTSDAMTKPVFILGWQKGLAMINSMTGISAVIVDKNGEVHYSDDLKELNGKKVAP